MSQSGYIYLLIRADFIQNDQYIYKIGKTTRHPPHTRLWEYPHGSLFLTLIKTLQTTQFEKDLIHKLKNTNSIIWEKEIGEEYFSGQLNDIILIMQQISYIYPADIMITQSELIDEKYLLKLNRIHYIPKFKPTYFDQIFKNKYFGLVDEIKSELIYESYHKARSWHSEWPDNYVIRCGYISIKPTVPKIIRPNQNKFLKITSHKNKFSNKN